MQKMSIDDLMTELDDARLTAKANGQTKLYNFDGVSLSCDRQMGSFCR